MENELSPEEINEILDLFEEWLGYANIVSLDIRQKENGSGGFETSLHVGRINEGELEEQERSPELLFAVPDFVDIPNIVRGLEESESNETVRVPVVVETTEEILEEPLIGDDDDDIFEEAQTKQRPCPGGYLIRTHGLNRGSIALSIMYRGAYRLLSNNHVLAKNGHVGIQTYQPTDPIATNKLLTVSGFDTITYYANKNQANPTRNEKDVAWCDSTTSISSQEVRSIGKIAGRRSPKLGETVQIFGGKTEKLETAKIQSVTLRYRSKGSLGYSWWRNGIELDKNITQGGDSGTAYIAKSDKKVVALHRAGGSTSKGCPL